jgi:hypothetical protein
MFRRGDELNGCVHVRGLPLYRDITACRKLPQLRNLLDEHPELWKRFGDRLLLLGGPGETKQSVDESVVFVRSLDLEMLRVSVGIRLYPQTPLARRTSGRTRTVFLILWHDPAPQAFAHTPGSCRGPDARKALWRVSIGLAFGRSARWKPLPTKGFRGNHLVRCYAT